MLSLAGYPAKGTQHEGSPPTSSLGPGLLGTSGIIDLPIRAARQDPPGVPSPILVESSL